MSALDAAVTACPDCGEVSSEDYGNGRCWPCMQAHWLQADVDANTTEADEGVRQVRHPLGTGADGAGAPSTEDARYRDRIIDVGDMLARPDEPVPWRCADLAADGYLTV